MTEKEKKRKAVKKRYDKIKPYIKSDLIFVYLSRFYGTTLNRVRLSDYLCGRRYDNEKLEQIDSVIQFIQKTHKL